MAHHSWLITHGSSLMAHHSSLRAYHSSLRAHHSSLIIHGSSLMAHGSSLMAHHSSLTAHHSLLMSSTHHDSWLPSRILALSWLYPGSLLVPILTLLVIVFLIVNYGKPCSFIFCYREKPRGNSDRPFFTF